MKENFFCRKNNYTALSFLIPFTVYLITLAPSISYVDSDELATAASLLKIAHPTGYPLFTILGKVFTFIPMGDEVWRLNFMSALVSSVAISLFYNLMVFLFCQFKTDKSDKVIADSISTNVSYNIALSSALVLAFADTIWDIANVAEVYSLHSFFLILLIYIFLRSISYGSKENNLPYYSGNYFLLFAFVLGLSFANHLTTAFLSIGMIYMYFSVFGINKRSMQQILFASVPFILGLTLYIYLFVRADSSLLSWGHTFTLDNFIAHITGRQYNTAMFRSMADVKHQLSRFFEQYPAEFVLLNVFLIFPGLIELYRNSRKLFSFTLILFITCVLLAANYNIFDIHSYFLLALIITAVWIGFGILYFVRSAKKNALTVGYVSLILFMIPLVFNFSGLNKANDYLVKDYVFNQFNSAPENSIIISNYNPTYYFQYVKKVRPDLIFINRDYLYNRWYLDATIETYPEIYEKSKLEFDNYALEVDKLHKNKSRYLRPQTQNDRSAIMNFQNALRDLLNSIIEQNYLERGVYTTAEIDEVNDEKFGMDYFKIPNGVLLKLTKEKNPADHRSVDLHYTVSHDQDFFKSYIMNNYYKSYINETKYLMDNSEFDAAAIKIEKARELKPDSHEPQQLMIQLEQLKSKNK